MIRYIAFLSSFVLFPKNLFAQDLPKSSEFIQPDAAKADRIKVTGWDKYLSLGITGNVTDNDHVVGKDDGQSTTVGAKIDGAIDYKEANYEWFNTLTLIASATRTPLLPRYVKADDNTAIESLYKYYFSEIFGSYARFNADAPLFDGYDTRTTVNDYTITRRDGTVQSENGSRLKLTDGLKPLKLRESIGAFTTIFNQAPLKWDVKLGLGLRQVYADHQFVLADNKDTLPIEVNEIRNSSKAGYEVGTDLGGATSDKRVTYKLSVNVLFPFYERPENTATGDTQFEKRVVDVAGNLSFHLLEWASLDYVLRALRDPSILQRAQVSQSYLFSLNKVLAARRE